MVDAAFSTSLLYEVALILFGYLCGSVPLGWLAVRWRARTDIRALGTGNPGTANIYRNVGLGLAAVVGPAQFALGLLPVAVSRWTGAPEWLLAAVAVAALAGNAWPVWLRFNGGRGIAVGTGAAGGLGLVPLGVLLAFYLAGFLVRQIALGVLAGFVALPVAAAVMGDGILVAAFVAMLAIVLVRRLEGYRQDAARGHGGAGVIARRLLFDRRPDRPLVGLRPESPELPPG